MDLLLKRIIAIAVCVAVAIAVYLAIDGKMERLRSELERYRTNTETLMSEAETFCVRDSLNAAKVEALELTLREFRQYRAEDAALIKSLKARNHDLAAINSAQSQTIIELSSVPRDTVIVRDSIKIPARAVHCGDRWFDFDGVITEDSFSGTLRNRDSLLLAETVRYGRFLWWRTKKVKERELSVLSKNPHTEIIGTEYVLIKK